jgi:NAD(P)-dependent dehydrogenase (short-subunit alcohol dehydrogenase family)
VDRLKGKVAAITGASSGVGRAIALALAAEGAKVVCSDVRRKPKEGWVDGDQPTDEAIRAAGGEAIFVDCDVTKRQEVQSLIQAAVDNYGQVNIMVNNAGVPPSGAYLLHEWSEADLDACYTVNTKGTFFGMQEAIKQFLKQGDGGSIVNIVSTAGLAAYPRQAVYNASKGAVARLTESVAIEYGRDRIRANGICPTYVRTAMSKVIWEDDAFSKLIVDALPLHRFGEVEDVAALAVFLASDESSFMTGDLIRLDGGDQVCRFSI